MNQDDTITSEDLKQTIKQTKTFAQHVKNRLKDPKFWFDNALLIALAIIVTYFGIKGHYIDTHIIEVPSTTCLPQVTP